MTPRHGIGEHDDYEALAIGWALSCLEPADEEAFVAHLSGCAECSALVEETRRTAQNLAALVPDADPPPELRERLLDAVVGEPQLLAPPQPPNQPATPHEHWDVIAPVSAGDARGRADGPSGASPGEPHGRASGRGPLYHLPPQRPGLGQPRRRRTRPASPPWRSASAASTTRPAGAGGQGGADGRDGPVGRDGRVGRDGPVGRDAPDNGRSGSWRAAGGSPPDGRTRALDRWGRRPVWGAAALVLVLVAGLVMWNSSLRADRSRLSATLAQREALVDDLSRGGTAHVAALADPRGTGPRLAIVVIRTGGVDVVSDGLPPNTAVATSYWLWSLTAPTDQHPVPIAAFDVPASGLGVHTLGADGSQLGTVPVFAISREPGRSRPSRPTELVAVGRVTG